MSATYDPTLPTDKDWVRLLAGDRDVSDPRLSDEEILGLLSVEENYWYAAARACEVIQGAGAGAIEKAVGDLRIKFSDSAANDFSGYIKGLRVKGATVLLKKSGSSVLRTL